jgi:GT2 family glycosyltransferase
VKSLTIAIPSYQRRDRLLRLLSALDDQISGSSGDMQVVVVIDGSTDGSVEALRRLKMAAPLEVRSQPNLGRASARNSALSAAQGELIWFLDDDLIPSPGLLDRHRTEHEKASSHLMLGPCPPSATVAMDRSWMRWWEDHHAGLEQAGRVDRFDRFTVANLSGPTHVFRAAGGFDGSFTEYGLEDFELGVRLLAAGVEVRFDAQAVAWHDHSESQRVAITRNRSIGRNSVRLAAMHPETAPVLFPERAPDPAMRLLRILHLRSPRLLNGVSRLAAAGGLHAPRWSGRYGVAARHLASAAAFAAGVAEADPARLPAVLEGNRHARAR